MRNLKAGIAIVLTLLILIVILQNTESVETKFLFMTVIMPRALLLILTFLFGVVCGMLMFAFGSKLPGKESKKKAND